MIFAQDEFQEIARVNLIRMEPITLRQLKQVISPQEKAAGRNMTTEQRRIALDRLVEEKLILQAAERDKVTIADIAINNWLANAKNQLSQQLGRLPTDDELAQAMQIPAADVRETVRKQLLMQKYLMEKKQTQINTIKEPTEEEILRVYNYRKTQFVRPDTVRINYITIPYGTGSNTKIKAKEIADRLARDTGSKFDDIVLRGLFRTSAEQQARIAELGYVSGSATYLTRTPEHVMEVGEKFLNIAFGLKQGEVSPLFDADYGYCFVKVTEILPQKTLELDEIINPADPDLTSVRKFIREGLATEQRQKNLEPAYLELLDELKKGKGVVTYNEPIPLNW
jgi:hypothetical protein